MDGAVVGVSAGGVVVVVIEGVAVVSSRDVTTETGSWLIPDVVTISVESSTVVTVALEGTTRLVEIVSTEVRSEVQATVLDGVTVSVVVPTPADVAEFSQEQEDAVVVLTLVVQGELEAVVTVVVAGAGAGVAVVNVAVVSVAVCVGVVELAVVTMVAGLAVPVELIVTLLVVG